MPRNRATPAPTGQRNNERDACELFACALALALALAAFGAVAQAQTPAACPSVQGFTQNRDKPVQIEAASLEVRDKRQDRDLHRQCGGDAGRHHFMHASR